MVQLFPLIASYEEWITDAVEKHAQSRGLKSEIWHQNEAIWYIYGYDDRDPGRIKSVQVIAFEAEDEPKIFFIPNISMCDLDKRQMHTFEVPSDSIIAVPVSILYQKKRDECIQLIRQKINEAWSATERLEKTAKLTEFPLPANKLV